MGTRRAICVSRDAGVRSAVEEALAGDGLAVDLFDSVTGLDLVHSERGNPALIVVDRATREAAGDRLKSLGAPVVIVGDDLEDDGVVSLMTDAPVSHLVEDPRDVDLEITSRKLVSGDLFGLDKYLAADARVRERTVSNDLDRRLAIGEVSAWAESVGARRPVVHRISNVVDELLMNALVDAPSSVDSPTTPAMLRFASDDRVIAVSVTDRYGALRQRDLIANVQRARRERGRPQPDPSAGAGLGLYFVLANVASLIVNVEAGVRTEVVCLFDAVRPTRRPAVAAGVRSLHVFT